MKKKSSKKKYVWLLLLAPALLLAGCGNTIKQSIKAGKCALDIPLAVYEDVTGNAATVKDAVVNPTPPPSK
jgi:hypothetical protein